MKEIYVNFKSTDDVIVGRQYERNKTMVVFSGFEMEDEANELYLKVKGRTAADRLLIPIVDMKWEITQPFTRKSGKSTIQLEERRPDGTFVSESGIARVVVLPSLEAAKEYEVVDDRLETVYQKYHEMYITIHNTNEQAIANESERESQWLTLKAEVQAAVDDFKADVDVYKGETTTSLITDLNNYKRTKSEELQSELDTYENNTSELLWGRFQNYSDQYDHRNDLRFEELKTETTNAINNVVTDLERRRDNGEFDGKPGKDGEDGEDGKDYVITEADYTAIGNKVEAEYTPELTNVRESLTQLESSLEGYRYAEFTPVNGKIINTIGNEANSENYAHTTTINVQGCEYISVNYTKSNPYFGFIAFYSRNTINHDYLVGSVITSVTDGQKIKVPSGAVFVVGTYNKTEIANYEMKLIGSKLAIIDDELQTQKTRINGLEQGEIEHVIPLTFTTDKAINQIGNIVTSTGNVITQAIDVSKCSFASVNFSKSNPYITSVAFYSSAYINALTSSKLMTTVVADEFIPVPSDALYMIVTGLATTKETLVVKTKTVSEYEQHSVIKKNNKGVFFGDSIMYGVGVITSDGAVPDRNAPSVASRLLGCEIYNGGLGGSTLCRPTIPNGNNFCELVDAICGVTNWDKIDERVESAISESTTWLGYRTTIGELKTLDFNTVDFIVIAYGTNDWTADFPIGEDTSTSEAEFIGALKYCINKMLTACPQLKIYTIAPAYRYNKQTGVDSDVETYGGKNLRQYADGIAHASSLLSLPCLNLYSDGMVNKYNRDKYLSDGVHRTVEGYKLLGEQYAKFVTSK